MDRVTDYLRIPSSYMAGLNRLRWTVSGEVVAFGDGPTFAFRAEIFQFLEGFVSQRPLIHFAHILHLMYMLRQGCAPMLCRDLEPFRRAYQNAGRLRRNAGVFCAVLCEDVPPAPDPPLAILPGSFVLEVGASEPLFTIQEGETPPLPPEVFETRFLHALSSYRFEEMLHWFRHGRGSVAEAGDEIARSVILDKPRSLQGVLTDLSQRRRLCGAVPFVDQLVSALTLPPRRLEQPALPLGGYSDVTTRGHVEQLLPSQFAFDDLEFVRRHAEHELLYFRREEPHLPTREDLVVLVDQGVRTWGTVRLVLTAALFALGQLAERRRLPFLVTSTSAGGNLLDPLLASPAELEQLVEASDLSAHPAASLERVVAEETVAARDIILLTHPRNLSEMAVMSAARQLSPETRLFAVAVDEHGDVQFSALRQGLPVCLSRFHVDLQRTAPPPVQADDADERTPWRGEVEPIGYPFQFGAVASHYSLHFAFDAAGEWLLLATVGGMLHATKTDGSRSEILPRALVDGAIVSRVNQVIGVAGGFVVVSVRAESVQAEKVLVLHYNFPTRTCIAHSFMRVAHSYSPSCFYLRKLHTLVVPGHPKTECVHLSTGSRERPPAVHDTLHARMGSIPLNVQGEGEPQDANTHWSWPQMSLDPKTGTINLKHVFPPWETFTPLADNQPILKGCQVEQADCQGFTLAAVFTNPGTEDKSAVLRLFRGPQGIPLAAFQQKKTLHHFALSSDGRLLARELGRGRIEIRDVFASGPPRHITSVGRFHPELQVEFGERWLSFRIANTVHLAHWHNGSLVLKRGQWSLAEAIQELGRSGLSTDRICPRSGRLPNFLLPDTSKRFVRAAWSNLIVVVDCFGEVGLFEQTGELVCLFFVFRQQIAVWMPDGTCHGPLSLLGWPATPGALDKIGAALQTAWEHGERTIE